MRAGKEGRRWAEEPRNEVHHGELKLSGAGSAREALARQRRIQALRVQEFAAEEEYEEDEDNFDFM